MSTQKEQIEQGQTALGIEFGSTRIKAVLTSLQGTVLAIGTWDWENSLKDGIWTYSYEEIQAGLQGCYASLKEAVQEQYGVTLKTIGAIGISAMMHGYIVLNKEGEPIAPFQTWRNSNTQQAADALTALFDFNIPLRWTIAHLYQCMLDHEAHLTDAAFVTTLDSYIHFRLTGEKVTGIGDASGIFPIDSKTKDYDETMVQKFDALPERQQYSWHLRDLLPKVRVAGDEAGRLTAEGAKLLDPSGDLQAGIPFCPPEGDAGTGMAATNSVAPGTGNVSAGTSTFAMIVLDKPLSRVYREIDMVTTPDGAPCAMSHANNGTTDLNAWVGIFKEFAELTGQNISDGDLYGLLYKHSLKGDADCGGLLSYGYYSGEGVTHLNEGRPLYTRTPDAKFTLANLMRSHLYTSLGAVKMGMDILTKQEHVQIRHLTGHGGLFKTEGVGQRYLAAAVNAPVTVMKNAGEGGPWGMALLALYMLYKKDNALSLGDYLSEKIFASLEGSTMEPDPVDVQGFETFMEHYRAGLSVEKAAIDAVRW